MKETLIDHTKTIGIIIGVILATVAFAFLIAEFGDYIIGLIMVGLVGYVIYATYTGVLKEVRLSKKRKEVENARETEE